jgi:hypothetical protein
MRKQGNSEDKETSTTVGRISQFSRFSVFSARYSWFYSSFSISFLCISPFWP